MFQGFKTVIFNVVAVAAIWLNNQYGIEIDSELQSALAVTIMGVGNIILRKFTKTPIFKKE